jgi:hypothetical protein
VKEALDTLLSGDALRQLLERTGGLLDQLAHSAYDGVSEDDDDQGEDDDQQGGGGEYGSCQGSGQATTWWSGSARSGCS